MTVMQQTEVPVLGFAAYSGAGKTTLLTQLIPQLTQTGLRVGLIKHSHHAFDIDQPGKDSYRLRAAGASTVLLVSPYRRALITDFTTPQEPELQTQLAELQRSQLDLILVEGFRHSAFPKIELHRPALQKPLLYPHDPNIIAVATDAVLTLPKELILLDLNQPAEITRFILNLL